MQTTNGTRPTAGEEGDCAEEGGLSMGREVEKEGSLEAHQRHGTEPRGESGPSGVAPQRKGQEN